MNPVPHTPLSPYHPIATNSGHLYYSMAVAQNLLQLQSYEPTVFQSYDNSGLHKKLSRGKGIFFSLQGSYAGWEE